MNVHPDTLTRAAAEMHRQRLNTAQSARLFKQAQRSNLEPPSRNWLTRLVDAFAGTYGRGRTPADSQLKPATTSIADNHAWTQL
jgi:hypothetical protein